MRLDFAIIVSLAFMAAPLAHAETATGYVQKGETALAARDAASAMQAFDKALELDPQNGTAAFERGKMKLKIGEAKGAVADFTVAILANAVNVEAYLGRGEAKMKLQPPDSKGALDDFQLAVAAAPQRPEPLLVRASYLMQMGDMRGAKADLESALPMTEGQAADSIHQILERLK